MITLEEMSMLTTLYTQPHRKYHNINHINDCLVELENIPHWTILTKNMNGINEIDIVESAIWYHDAVYNPYSKQNEYNSADLLPEITEKNRKFIPAVRHAILSTAFHLITQNNLSPAAQVMLDIDLSGFGKDRFVFAQNGINIRYEYYNTKLKEFLEGRYKFYQALVKRPTLYYTEHFYNLYHTKSRENIEWEISLLEDSFKHDDTNIWYNEMQHALEGY